MQFLQDAIAASDYDMLKTKRSMKLLKRHSWKSISFSVAYALPAYQPIIPTFSDGEVGASVVAASADPVATHIMIKRPMIFYAVYRMFEDEDLFCDHTPNRFLRQGLVLNLLVRYAMPRNARLMRFIMWQARWHLHGRVSDEVHNDTAYFCMKILEIGRYFSALEDIRFGVAFMVRQKRHLTLDLMFDWLHALLIILLPFFYWGLGLASIILCDSILRGDSHEILAFFLYELRPRRLFRSSGFDVVCNYIRGEYFILDDFDDFGSETLLHVLVRSDRPDSDRLRVLLEVGRQDPLIQDRMGRTPLQLLEQRIHLLPEECVELIASLREGETQYAPERRDLMLVLGMCLSGSKSPLRLLDAELLHMVAGMAKLEYTCQ